MNLNLTGKGLAILLLALIGACNSFSDECPTIEVPLGMDKIETKGSEIAITFVSGSCTSQKNGSDKKNLIADLTVGLSSPIDAQAFLRVAALDPEGEIIGMNAKLFNLNSGSNQAKVSVTINSSNLDFTASATRLIVALVP